MLEWLNSNVDFLSLSIQFLELLASLFLTFLIIYQNHRLNKKQQIFELNLNNKQIEIQKKQILLDTFPYKREIYSHVFNVLELCNQFEKNIKVVDLKSLEPAKIKEYLEILQNNYVPDTTKTMWSMREAEYIMPKNIADTIIDIRRNYIDMCANLMVASNFSKLLKGNEITNEIRENINHNIDKSIECCMLINKHARFIESIMSEELNISNLSN